MSTELMLTNIIKICINNIDNDNDEIVNEYYLNQLNTLNDYKYNQNISKAIGDLTNNGKLYNFDNKFSNLFQNTVKDINTKHYYKDLKKFGYKILDKKIDSETCDKIIKQLENKEFKVDTFKNNQVSWIKNQDDALLNDTNSFISDLAFDPFFLEIAKEYLGTNPIFIQSNYWVTEYKSSNTNEVKSATQTFHQDYDDINFLKIFIYLTDVDENTGPHRYIKSSLKNMITPENYKPSGRLTDDFIKSNYEKDVVHIIGKKGTILLENTRGFHSGSELKEGKRCILQFQYGISKVPFTNHKYPKSTLIKNNFMKDFPICFSKFNDIDHSKFFLSNIDILDGPIDMEFMKTKNISHKQNINDPNRSICQMIRDYNYNTQSININDFVKILKFTNNAVVTLTEYKIEWTSFLANDQKNNIKKGRSTFNETKLNIAKDIINKNHKIYILYKKIYNNDADENNKKLLLECVYYTNSIDEKLKSYENNRPSKS